MKYILVFAAVFTIPLVILWLTGQEKKRGCGRGCATCGNRDICYRRKKEESGETAQKKG